MKENHATAAAAGHEPSACGPPVLSHEPGGWLPRIGVTCQRRWLSTPHKLVALPTAAGCARRYARAQAHAWQLHELAGSAELLASELVTRAVATTGALAPARYVDLYDSSLNFVILRLRAWGPGLVIEVWDRDPEPPGFDNEPAGDDNQWCRRVLAALSSRWGYYPSAEGKVVWCECLPGSHAAHAGFNAAGALPAEPATMKVP